MMRTSWVDWYGYVDVQADWRREAQRARLVREALGHSRFYLPGDVQMLIRGVRRLAAWVAAHLSPSRPDQQEPPLPFEPRRRHGV